MRGRIRDVVIPKLRQADETVRDRRLYGVGAFVRVLDDHVCRAIDDVGVVPLAPGHRVIAAAAIKRVVAVAPAQQDAGAGTLDDLGGIRGIDLIVFQRFDTMMRRKGPGGHTILPINQ
jgi:hypothetical protein